MGTVPALNQPPSESPRVSFDDFLDQFEWSQGEHVSMIGPTGCGKTTLSEILLPRRKFVVVFACKSRDKSMDRFLRRFGYTKQVKHFQPEIANRIVLWPELPKLTSESGQKAVFEAALNTVFRQGGWCIDFDELAYLSDMLNLSKHLRMMYQQGRSSFISILAMTQRPAFVPLAMYDQADHLFFWRDNDHTNLRRIGNLGGADSRQIRQEVMRLGGVINGKPREVLYLNARTGERLRTIVEV